MSGTRAKLGFGDALDDLGSFIPSSLPKSATRPEAAAAAGFKRREPVPAAVPDMPRLKQQRRRRTGRNAQINIKATQETLDRFYAAVDEMECGVGEAFERAVDLLRKSLSDS